MTMLTTRFLTFLVLGLPIGSVAADSITKCVDAAGHITFTTMGCKASETDIKAVEEAKARVAAEEKAKAEASAEEAAARAQKMGIASPPTAASTTTNTSSTSSESNVTSPSTQSQSSGNKTGTRGSINGDLTVGYQ